ncbi:hypothetical protein PQX77_020293 [Marasmius sp. AFHP31]|nr:hypothetical protein PQX77_020293 [Marasmius sp. AFHP31]
MRPTLSLVNLIAFTAALALAATPARGTQNHHMHRWCFSSTKNDASGQGYVVDEPYPCAKEEAQGVPTRADADKLPANEVEVDDLAFLRLLRGDWLGGWDPVGRVVDRITGGRGRRPE